MNSDRWKNEAASSQAIDVFFDALEIEVLDQRSAFLDLACAGDETLRLQVESMLALHGESEPFFADDRHLQMTARDLYDTITNLQNSISDKASMLPDFSKDETQV